MTPVSKSYHSLYALIKAAFGYMGRIYLLAAVAARPDCAFDADEAEAQRLEACRNEALYATIYGRGDTYHTCPGCDEITYSATLFCDTCLALGELE